MEINLLSRRLALLMLAVSFVTLSNAQWLKKKEVVEEAPKKAWEIDTLVRPIPINRQIFADHVAAEIRKADLRDGAADGRIDLDDKDASQLLTEVFLVRAPLIAIHIENLEEASHQTKVRYYRSLQNLLRKLNHRSFDQGDLSYFRKSIENFEEMMIAIESGEAKQFVRKNLSIYSIDNSSLLENYPNEKAYLYEQYGKMYPQVMIRRLPEFGREKFADPIVSAAAKVTPGIILNYATSTSYLSSVVRRNQDPLVQTIVRIGSESKNPLRALPFLEDIHTKSKTIAEVDKLSADEKTYYKALVALKVENKMVGLEAIDDEINYRGLHFVRVVNELHEKPTAVRFHSLLDFNAEELYFMMIGSQDEIYTSSFTWMFNRMMDRMKPETSDDFLARIHNSHFRTFIRMCAGYNTLAAFLGNMPEKSKEVLMKQFVANLEQGTSDDLEDAVDVADAFGSITDPALVSFLKEEVKENYERVYRANNEQSEKGVIVYGLLSTIFNSAENSSKLSGALSVIPPITYVPNQSLVNADGQIVVQVFFYGDEDGRMSFNSFKSNFASGNWKSASTKHWVTYTSSGKTPIVVYANFPFDEPEDETAQRALKAYFDQNDIKPTIVVHRGHSYHLDGSLANLSPEVKVVMLGSCGGYHNLARVLDKAPDANIISSKQVGAASINEPIIREMFKQLSAGQDLNWINAWRDLNKYFSGRGAHERDLFSDYIPPNRNLGAIFIKAYRKLDQQGEMVP